MAEITWAGVRVEQAIDAAVTASAREHGVPVNVPRAIIIMETALGGRVRPDAIGDGGKAVGLLQLHDGGQGRGMSIADRLDPVKNLARGMPAIADAWARNGALGNTRNRVERTAAQSGHPRDPDGMDPGSFARTQVENAIRRVGDVWEQLEAERPTIPPGTSVAGLSAEGLERALEEALGWVKEHPVEAAAGVAVGVVALLL